MAQPLCVSAGERSRAYIRASTLRCVACCFEKKNKGRERERESARQSEGERERERERGVE